MTECIESNNIEKLWKIGNENQKTYIQWMECRSTSGKG